MKLPRLNVLFLAGVAVLTACQRTALPENASDAEKQAAITRMYANYKTDFPDVPDVGPEEAQRLRDAVGAILVDTRTPEEQAISRIPGAITAESFEASKEIYRDQPIVTYCTIGARSGAYARGLRAEGWDARNLRGSILAWTHAQLPLEAPNGEATTRLHVYGPAWNLAADGYEAVW